MKTLIEAWEWYTAARDNLLRMKRLAIRHWNDESLRDSSIWKDERFKQIEAGDLESQTSRALAPLEDLGVLVLFSVFEAAVRDHLEKEIRPESDKIVHLILRQAADEVFDGIRQGSLANHVLTPLKDQGKTDPNLSDKVKQVRDYRNWVAHGKREPRPMSVVNLAPLDAFDRLREFLDVLGIPTRPDLVEHRSIDERRITNELD